MKLIVLTPEHTVPGELEIINELFRSGLNYLHLRKPAFTINDTRNYLYGIEEKYRPLIALHQHQEIISPEFEMKRIHFPEKKRKETQLVELELLKEKGFYLSTSVHTASDLTMCSDYFQRIFLGPVFNSISKKDYTGKTFPILKHQGKAEIIGIGGVKNSNISTLNELGYDGGALLGWIWENPSESVQRFKSVAAKWAMQDHTH